MSKKVLILVRTCPYGNATAGEAFRMASGLAGMEHDVEVVFMQDGVFSAVKWQKPEIISMSDISKAFGAIGEFGAKTYIVKECTVKRNIKPDDIAFGDFIDYSQLKRMIDVSDFVFSFS